MTVPYFCLQDDPLVYVAKIPGNWLLAHCNASWRVKEREHGFQRIVTEKRAIMIAEAVLRQHHTFPNAVIVATDAKSEEFPVVHGELQLPGKTRFLIVDGQHRLYAQKYSPGFEAKYAVVIHMALPEVQMARLFMEINENQKKTPASLRWDLYRLATSSDPFRNQTSRLIHDLWTAEDSPLRGRVDLTGEDALFAREEARKKLASAAKSAGKKTKARPVVSETKMISQYALAVEIYRLLRTRTSPLFKIDYESKVEVFKTYFAALRSIDADAWDAGTSPYFSARVVRAALKLMEDILVKEGGKPESIAADRFGKYLARIRPSTFNKVELVKSQGEAGIRGLYKEMLRQAIPT